MSGFLQTAKTVGAVLLVLVGLGASSTRLMKIQLSEQKEYTAKNVSKSKYTQVIDSSRGEITDVKGRTIVGNKVGYNVVIRPEKFPTDNKKGNEIILKITDLLKKNNIKWDDSLLISDSKPYKFTNDDETAQKQIKKKLNLNVYATADNCIDKIIDDYDISDNYSDKQKRTIAGVRYEMLVRQFSMSSVFTLAKGVNKDIISDIEEMSNEFPGVDVQEAATRKVVDGNVVPHEIGTVGPIYAEEYEKLKDKGYSLDDTVGKSGIELAMEDELRGTDGEKTVSLEDDKVVSSEVTKPAVNGNTVRLTVDSEYEKGLQNILDNFITEFPTYGSSLSNVHCGALAVLDCSDGSVLGLATSPTYDLGQYEENYDEIANAENSPLVDRATMGLYRPGSTFKVITATAGLNEGIVTPETTFDCEHTYKYVDTVYSCTGWHGNIAIARALMVSCNIYFYHLSEMLTIDKISEYAKMFGLSESTGIETGDESGRIGDQETYASMGQQWTVGQVLQTGIGNSDTAVTPLQMAEVALTVANKGVGYTPHLVDSIYDYSGKNLVKKHETTVKNQINTKVADTWDTVKEGMIMASTNNFPAKYSLTNLGYDVAIKTGTPQVDSRVQDTLFIGFAPADKPKIAFCGVVEGGDYSKYMIRPLLRLYESVYGKFDGSTFKPSEVASSSNESTESSSSNEGESKKPVEQDYAIVGSPDNNQPSSRNNDPQEEYNNYDA